MTTNLYTHPIYLEHLTPPGHPERPERLRALLAALEHEDFAALTRVQSPRGSEELVLLAHPEDFLAKVASSIPEQGLARIDADTVASPQSFEAVMHAIGAANAAVDAVFAGTADNAFVACRPPGHHAERETAMGFCFFNTVAIAARHAQEKHGAERVAIVDWDVHHGNGTQDIFWDDKSVLYCSTHQMPLYPGTGARKEQGTTATSSTPPWRRRPAARPSAPPSTSSSFRRSTGSSPTSSSSPPASTRMSAIRSPRLISTEDDFDWATAKLMDRAGKFAGNRLVSLLEGGYDLEGLSLSAAAHVRRLMRG